MLTNTQRTEVMAEIANITNSAELFLLMASDISQADYQYGTPELDLAAQHAAQSKLLEIAMQLSA